MTQDLSVQTKKPSALVYGVGGMAAGAAAGWGASCIPALKSARYTSWEDITKESVDSFKKLGEAVKDNEGLKKSYNAIEAKKKEYFAKFRELLKDAKFDEKVKTEGEAALAKREELKNVTQDFLNKIKNGDLGFDKTKVEPDKLEEAARKYLKENMDKDEFKTFKDALTACKDANKALVDKAKAENVESYRKLTEDGAKTLKEKGEQLFKDLADDVKNFKVPRLGLLLGIGAGVGLLAGIIARNAKAKKAEQQAALAQM